MEMLTDSLLKRIAALEARLAALEGRMVILEGPLSVFKGAQACPQCGSTTPARCMNAACPYAYRVTCGSARTA
jgi:hypothetical protein